MRFPKVDRILKLLKQLCTLLLPLFLGAISIRLLVSASVPGQSHGLIFDTVILSPFILIYKISVIFGILPGLVIIVFLISIIILLTYYLYHRWRRRDRLQIAEILSLSIAIITSLLLSYDIPAQLRFYTSATEFDRVAQQIIDGKDYQTIKEVGNFNIIRILLNVGSLKRTPITSIYFSTGDGNGWMMPDRDDRGFGFAYILDRDPTSHNKIRYTHIHGKWYIFER